ncbi:head GIN domain-containing protein [Sphingopyxis sp. MWB1]|uniref:head GIN domain-containing protein n=1 Tax=Sphingopyxis sp. MWB1 TaxID=1537715 RepID=UPI0006902BE2|nr:head GIN domain-containing protein [Sphingopyxis sp. MWB1]
MHGVFRIFALFLLCSGLAGTAGAAEKRYGLTSFESIEVLADVTVEVTARAPVSAVASGPQAALDRLSVEARDGRLVISMRQFAGDDRRARTSGPVTVRVNAANLRAAMLVGVGSLEIDRLQGRQMDIALKGPGRLSVKAIDGDRLAVAMVGNGVMTLGGAVNQARVILSGAGSLDARNLRADTLVNDSEGAGEHIFHAVKSATITTRGNARTIVEGRPTCKVRNIGAGSVVCGGR